ncbi:MAG: tryptophan-rich sensory protein [Arenicella sp.]|nr:tryptophan-rich sensory protein [Arenicella sp.]
MKSLRLEEKWPSLIAFLLICFAVFSVGGLFRPGDWSLALNQAPWSPPNMAFPIVWAFLYVFIAIAGWQIYHRGNSTLKALWITQLILNGLWSWVFIGQHWVVVALVNIVFLDILVINLILKARRAGLKTASLLLTPYIIWLLLATSLNTYIVLAN